jgi:hypothetical protein
MSEAQVQFDKLKGLLEAIDQIRENKKIVNLREAELNLKANEANVEATSNLERNLRGVRVMYLSSLEGMIKKFGGQ